MMRLRGWLICLFVVALLLGVTALAVSPERAGDARMPRRRSCSAVL